MGSLSLREDCWADELCQGCPPGMYMCQPVRQPCACNATKAPSDRTETCCGTAHSMFQERTVHLAGALAEASAVLRGRWECEGQQQAEHGKKPSRSP